MCVGYRVHERGYELHEVLSVLGLIVRFPLFDPTLSLLTAG